MAPSLVLLLFHRLQPNEQRDLRRGISLLPEYQLLRSVAGHRFAGYRFGYLIPSPEDYTAYSLSNQGRLLLTDMNCNVGPMKGGISGDLSRAGAHKSVQMDGSHREFRGDHGHLITLT